MMSNDDIEASNPNKDIMQNLIRWYETVSHGLCRVGGKRHRTGYSASPYTYDFNTVT